MPDPTSTESWVKLVGAAVTLATAWIGLATIIQSRRKTPVPEPEPQEAVAMLAPPTEPAMRDDPPLPGRPFFVNRERELDQLVSHVRAGHDNVIAIEGHTLVGKSAVARELVHCLRSGPPEGTFDPRRRFVWFDAKGGCPTLADICGRISLETDDQSLATAAEAYKRDKLRQHLGRSKTVLVLDNLSIADDPPSRTMIDFLDQLPDGSLVIASVNRRGGLGGTRVPLPDLDPDHVYELIVDRARRLALDGIEQFDRTFAQRLHELIGGNPGVIEWFLLRYRDSSETLEERLAAIEREGDLGDLFGPTWNALDDDCRLALQACAYLSGAATTRQLAIACGRSETELAATVDRLRPEGLLTPVRGKDRPTVHTCARAFQLFIGSETPTETCAVFTQRLADHYIAHFEANPEDAPYGATEVDALRIVREALIDAGDDERLQALFRGVLDILFTLGQYDELIAAAELSYLSAYAVDNFASAALAGAIKAGTHAIRGEIPYAEKALGSAVSAAANSRLPGPIAITMRCKGFVLYRSGKPLEALAAIEGAEELAREAGDYMPLLDTLDLRTAANWYLRRVDACAAAAQSSLEAGVTAPWERVRAYPLRYLAEVAIQRREPQRACELLDEAQEIAARFGDKRQLARVHLTRARMCLLASELDAGQRAAAYAVAEASRLGLPAEEEEALAVAEAIARAQRSRIWRRLYALRRPTRLTDAPVGGD